MTFNNDQCLFRLLLVGLPFTILVNYAEVLIWSEQPKLLQYILKSQSWVSTWSPTTREARFWTKSSISKLFHESQIWMPYWKNIWWFQLDKEILAMTCKSSAVKGLCTRTMKADGNTHWFSWFSPATSHKRFSSYTRHCGSSIIEARTTSFQYSNFHYIVHSKLIMQWFGIKVIVLFYFFSVHYLFFSSLVQLVECDS